MIQDWIKDKKEGRPLWLAECRQEALEDPDTTEIKISVITAENETKEFPIHLPKVEMGEEFEMMSRYLDANRCNAAALLGQQDSEDCRMPTADDLKKSMAEAEKAKGCDYEMPEEPLICGVDVGGTDIKLILTEGSRIRRILAYDWNPGIATEAAMIINPIYELIEMAANGMKLDGIGVAFPDVVKNNKIFDSHTTKTEGMRSNKNIDYKAEFEKLHNLDDFLRPLCKEGAPVRIINDGYMAAYTAYNELKQTEAGRQVIKDGIIALPVGTDIGFGWVQKDGRIPDYPGSLSKLMLRFDNEEDAHFLNQKRILQQAGLPTANPKPCVDLLMSMAEGGDQNAEKIFRNLGTYIGHVIREIKFFMEPETNTYMFLGRFAKREYIFDLICLGMQKIAPDVNFIQIDSGIANTPIMKALSDFDETAIAQFAQAVGCIYYAMEK